MELCDICNKEITASERTDVKTELIRKATSRGYLPPIAKSMGSSMQGLGISPKAMWNNTIEAGSATNWALCDICHKEITKYANKSGCFIATACYGSCDCVEVLQLRQFRDEKLLSSNWGKRLVAIYYRVSPPVARVLLAVPILKHFVKHLFVAPITFLIEKTMSKHT